MCYPHISTECRGRLGMGLAEAAASIPGHESGHLQNPAGQQVKQRFPLLHTHMFIDRSVCANGSAFFSDFYVVMIPAGV